MTTLLSGADIVHRHHMKVVPWVGTGTQISLHSEEKKKNEAALLPVAVSQPTPRFMKIRCQGRRAVLPGSVS